MTAQCSAPPSVTDGDGADFSRDPIQLGKLIVDIARSA
jgi:hypothetical protein